MTEQTRKRPAEKPQKFVKYHRDGSIWARGRVVDNVPTGYWEWFRKDGSRLRSGYFRDGIQVGEWTTYDKFGEAYKVTDMKDGRKDQPRMTIEPYPG